MTGMMAFSLAGHDKGKIYIIIEETQEYVYLSDGDIRPKENPKKKRKKHIQIIKKGMDSSLKTYSNEEIKRTIKLFKKNMMQEEKKCQNPT
ncbi:MAG: KOW domain-containing RNA-binding protein [Lachnospiraceae bacterium]